MTVHWKDSVDRVSGAASTTRRANGSSVSPSTKTRRRLLILRLIAQGAQAQGAACVPVASQRGKAQGLRPLHERRQDRQHDRRISPAWDRASRGLPHQDPAPRPASPLRHACLQTLVDPFVAEQTQASWGGGGLCSNGEIARAPLGGRVQRSCLPPPAPRAGRSAGACRQRSRSRSDEPPTMRQCAEPEPQDEGDPLHSRSKCQLVELGYRDL